MTLVTTFTLPTTRGDEGMYLFNDLPLEQLQARYDFRPSDAWAEHLQQASVRFNSGGSGSFVSSQGLVLTNHHVASDTLQKLSSAERNLIRDGFLATDHAQELRAPDLELNQLQSIEDVTDRVNASVSEGDSPDEAAKKRRGMIATIEKESLDQTGMRSDVVTLFGGAAYHLYRSRRYTDVRLVWAPETAAAFFGGDADNFEYPRYNLDATLFRVYENGQPARVEHFLRWSETPVVDGDLVFVSGHPGRTQRIFTLDALRYLRDQRLPHVLDTLRRKEILMQQFSLEGQEAARRARDELFGIQNARKAYTGMLRGLQNPATMSSKGASEARLLSRLEQSESSAAMTEAWREIAVVSEERAATLKDSVSLRSDLFQLALRIVLLTAENAKPNEERLAEYSEAARASLLNRVLSPAPLYRDLERVKLADELAKLAEYRGFEDELVAEVLAGRSPEQVASAAVAETQLMDVSVRKQLIDGGSEAVSASDDPMIRMALQFESAYRASRAAGESLDERERQAYAVVTAAKRLIDGKGGYPDATFTLRLAYGTVKGYQEDGQQVEPLTQMAGAFEHAKEHEDQKDFELPNSWYQAESRLDPAIPLNFVCTADIIGGNSGSPVVNRAGELVGLIFDGNIQSLTSDYLYTDEQARAVSVASQAITHAIEVIYQAPKLAAELGR
ncbi:MAG: S46 family peptidase [Planctomycetota bacterium]